MQRLFFLTAVVLTSVAAHAQVMTSANSKSDGPGDLTIAAFDPSDAVSPISVVEGPGVKVGEGTILKPVVGLETGFVSNVFYTNLDEKPAGVLRVFGQIGTGTLNAARLTGNVGEGQVSDDIKDSGSFEYQLNVRASYDQMLAGNEIVRDTGGLGIGAFFAGMANPQGKVSFGVDEAYTRLIRAANFETDANDNRDINNLRLTLLIHPPGRRLSGYLYYRNMLDIFESDTQTYPDRMLNVVGVHPMWRWLPETTLFADISQGVETGIGDSAASRAKVTSYPLTAAVGITTLLSLKTTFLAQVGYTNGFYSSGPSYSSPMLNTLATYRYSPKGLFGLSYDLLYSDSVNANFYRDHMIRAFVEQAIEPVVFMVQPELHFREYQGVTIPAPTMNRDDTIFAVRGGVHYTFRNWIAAVLEYKFSTVQTDFRYMDMSGATVNPSFVRHELMLGVRAAM